MRKVKELRAMMKEDKRMAQWMENKKRNQYVGEEGKGDACKGV